MIISRMLGIHGKSGSDENNTVSLQSFRHYVTLITVLKECNLEEMIAIRTKAFETNSKYLYNNIFTRAFHDESAAMLAAQKSVVINQLLELNVPREEI